MSARRWAVSSAATLLLLVAASAEVSYTASSCTAPQEITHFRVGLPNTAGAISSGKALVIVAIGSSSTRGVGASSAAHTYPALARRRSAAPLAAAPGDRSQQGRQRRDCLPDVGALRGRRAALPSAARHLADRYQPGVEERGHRGIYRHDTGGHQPSQGDKGGRRIDGSAVCPACNRAAHTPVHRGLHQLQ